jgi:hypothetical protein
MPKPIIAKNLFDLNEGRLLYMPKMIKMLPMDVVIRHNTTANANVSIALTFYFYIYYCNTLLAIFLALSFS